MARVQLTFMSGAPMAVEPTQTIAHKRAAPFARHVAGKRVPDRRTVLTTRPSRPVTLSKAAVVRLIH